jgi:hypothetical protein
MILVGSRALKLRLGGLFRREPADWDFACDEPEFNEYRAECGGSWQRNGGYWYDEESPGRVEIEVGRATTAGLIAAVSADKDSDIRTNRTVPSLDLLFTLKTSHRYLKNSPHFWKTLSDWHLMRYLGAKVRPEWADWLGERERETYAYKHPNLSKSKSAFFGEDANEYVYDHDSVHRAVAIKERPAYTYYMADGAEVQWDRDKFFALPQEYRINGVLEEAAVLAIERSLVPHPDRMSVDNAWRTAFSKVCTSITSGAFREFAYVNAMEILRAYKSYPYWEMFKVGLRDGVVKKT